MLKYLINSWQLGCLFFIASYQEALSLTCDPKGALSFCNAVEQKCPKHSDELYTHTVCEEKYNGKKCCRNTCDGMGSMCVKDSCSTRGLQESRRKCPVAGYICCTRSSSFQSVLKQKPVDPGQQQESYSPTGRPTFGVKTTPYIGMEENQWRLQSMTPLAPTSSQGQDQSAYNQSPAGQQSPQAGTDTNQAQNMLSDTASNPSAQGSTQGSAQEGAQGNAQGSTQPGTTQQMPQMGTLGQQPTPQHHHQPNQEQQPTPQQQQQQQQQQLQKEQEKQQKQEQLKLQQLQQMQQKQPQQSSNQDNQAFLQEMERFAQNLPQSSQTQENKQVNTFDNNQGTTPSSDPNANNPGSSNLQSPTVGDPAAQAQQQVQKWPQAAPTQVNSNMNNPPTNKNVKEGRQSKWNTQQSPGLLPMIAQQKKRGSRRKLHKTST